MRKSLLLLTMMFFSILASTSFGMPSEVSYQGRLTDAAGRNVDSFFDITFRLYNDSVGGSVLWQETQGVSVTGGLFSVRLGTIIPLDMSNMPVHPDSLWLGTQLGSDAELTPRTRLSSVPSAAVASSVRGDISTSPGSLTVRRLDADDDGDGIGVSDDLGLASVVVSKTDGVGSTNSSSLRVYMPGQPVYSSITFEKAAADGSDTLIEISASENRNLFKTYWGNGVDDDCDGRISADESGARMSLGATSAGGGVSVTNLVNRVDHRGHVTVLKIANGGLDTTNLVGLFGDPDFASVEVGDGNSPDSGIVVTSAVNSLDHRGHVTVLKIANGGLDTTNLVGLFGDPDFARIEVGDSAIVNSVRSSGISKRAARTGRNPQTGATLQMSATTSLSDTAGVSLSLRRLDEDSDDDGLLDFRVDNGSVSLRMNKADLVDAIASASMIIDSSEANLTLSKADAKRALEALTSNNSVSLTLIDSTLNDSGLIGLQISEGGNSGISVVSARKVAKFKAGAALAKAVNKAISPEAASPTGASMQLVSELDHFVEITVDSVSSSMVFADTLGDTTVVFQGYRGGGGGGVVKVISSNIGTGMAPSSAEISDLNADGLVDVRVDGNVGIRVSNPTSILQVQQGSLTDPIADAWTTYSSRRWKENIRTIDGALDKVQQLRGVEYDWKADGSHDIGLIAEEVGEVIPEVVVFEENGIDAKSVDYPRLVALLIEASKEQQNEIETMRAELAKLKTALTRLVNQSKSEAESSYGMR